jgi:hypothetical protein
MSTFFNTATNNNPEKEPTSKDVFLPPIQTSNNNNLDVGQKRTVPWLEDDHRDSKTPRTEEKLGKFTLTSIITIIIRMENINYFSSRQKNGRRQQ